MSLPLDLDPAIRIPVDMTCVKCGKVTVFEFAQGVIDRAKRRGMRYEIEHLKVICDDCLNRELSNV